jgi:hypothetical protein
MSNKMSNKINSELPSFLKKLLVSYNFTGLDQRFRKPNELIREFYCIKDFILSLMKLF